VNTGKLGVFSAKQRNQAGLTGIDPGSGSSDLVSGSDGCEGVRVK
jgi:hypothetical protein